MNAPQLDAALARYELAEAGSALPRGCVGLLASAKEAKLQKVVVAERSGAVRCFQLDRKAQREEVFAHHLDAKVQSPAGLAASMLVGGADRHHLSGLADRTLVAAVALAGDRTVVASAQEVEVLRKRGKVDLRFSTSLNEDVTCLAADEGARRVWAACEFVVSMFDEGRDATFYMAPDRVNHLVLAGDYCLVACNDRVVRALDRSGAVVGEATLSRPATCLALYSGQGGGGAGGAGGGMAGPARPNADGFFSSAGGQGAPTLSPLAPRRDGSVQVLAGTDGGGLVQLWLSPAGRLERGAQLRAASPGRGAVVCLAEARLLDGDPLVLVGADDGRLEALDFDEYGDVSVAFARELGESVQAVCSGHVVSARHRDVVAATFSGRVFCFTRDEPALDRVREADAARAAKAHKRGRGGSAPIDATAATADALRAEVAALSEKLAAARRKYKDVSAHAVAARTSVAGGGAGVRSTFQLLPGEACYSLQLELAGPIDLVLLRGTMPALLLDARGSQAIVSRTPDPEGGGALLATYRVPAGVQTNRLEVRLRTVEGRAGELVAHVVPRQQPKTTAYVRHPVPLLSLHERVAADEYRAAAEGRAMASMRVSGDFSLSEIHAWLGTCFSGSAPRPPDGGTGEVDLTLRSVFSGTLARCVYRRGHATVESDSVSTISIVNEAVSREATAHKVQVDAAVQAGGDALLGALERVRPRLDHHYALRREKALIAPLRELEAHEGGAAFLSKEHRGVLERADEIEAAVRDAPRHLEFIRGLVTDLFVDFHKLRGRSAAARMPALVEALRTNYDYDALVRVFRDAEQET